MRRETMKDPVAEPISSSTQQNIFVFAQRVSNWQPKNNEEDKGKITNDNLFVIGYRIGKVQLVWVVLVS